MFEKLIDGIGLYIELPSLIVKFFGTNYVKIEQNLLWAKLSCYKYFIDAMFYHL